MSARVVKHEQEIGEARWVSEKGCSCLCEVPVIGDLDARTKRWGSASRKRNHKRSSRRLEDGSN
jgi:hypothetical protein